MGDNEKFKNFGDFLLHSQEGDIWETEICYRDHLGNKVYKEGYEWLANDSDDLDEEIDDILDSVDAFEDTDEDDGSWLTDEMLEAGCKGYVKREMERLGMSKEEYVQYLEDKLKSRQEI